MGSTCACSAWAEERWGLGTPPLHTPRASQAVLAAPADTVPPSVCVPCVPQPKEILAEMRVPELSLNHVKR